MTDQGNNTNPNYDDPDHLAKNRLDGFRSPRIINIEWGRVIVEKISTFEDVKESGNAQVGEGSVGAEDVKESDSVQDGKGSVSAEDVKESGNVKAVQEIDSFKDVVLYPGGAESWDWKKNGTRHQPGIHRGDVSELISHDCEIIILSRGMQNMLHTSKEAHRLLEQKGMELNKNYFILQSEDAVKLYNQYAERKERVGALIHSTC
ncbi:unnamed protein product [Adineta steineri]|uniref:Uncharacterized protein n=1 Tax=Adineta steineri TaxID=433720 RepID=A0A819LEY9_9BILA|nr:unnamed protein product [Adineta steineri]